MSASDCSTRAAAVSGLVLAAAVLILVAGARATGRQASPFVQDRAGARFATETALVEVYVTVTDRAGRPVTGLTTGAFEVYEDGVRQQVTAFSAGEAPLSVALALDRSFSMRGERLAALRRAGGAFLGRLRPVDRAMLLSVGSLVAPISPMGLDRQGALDALATLDAWGTTPLFDAVIDGLVQLAPEPGRRALVLVTDGDERYSRTSAQEALDKARRSGILVYPVTLDRAPSPALEAIARATGARSFEAVRSTLAQVLETIADQLRTQYVLGYEPARPVSEGAGEWRRLSVVVGRADVTVRARDGYVAR